MKRIAMLIVASLFGVLFLAACGDDEPTEGAASFGTYNAGLAYGFVSYAAERQPLIGPAVAEVEADVICLQEVWRVEDVNQLLSDAAATFPHNYWVNTYDPEGNLGPPACTDEMTTDLRTCYDENCEEVEAGQLADCVLEFCALEFGVLSEEYPNCTNCLVGNLGNEMQEILSVCESESQIYAYGAANGVALISRYELRDTAYRILDSTFNKRIVLFARVASDSGGSVALACTHTTPEFDGVAYTGEYGSWVDEQALQIGQMLEFIDENAEENEPTVLMGDMNNGPELQNIDSDLPENFELFIDAGFIEPHVDSGAAVCTYCDENPLNVDLTRNVIIDHVFFRDFPSDTTFDWSLVLDEPISLETTDGTIESRLSDHYGVVVTVE